MESTTTDKVRAPETLPYTSGTHTNVETWLEDIRVKKSEGFEALVADDPKRGLFGVVVYKQVESGAEETHEYTLALRDWSRSLQAMEDGVKRSMIQECFRTGQGRHNLVLSL